MFGRMLILVVLAILLTGQIALAAQTWYIKPDGTGDAPTIQAGIDSAGAGDTVMLAAGTYIGVGNRNLSYNGKAITVTSESGAEATVIDCEGATRGFLFNNSEGPSSILSDVTVTNAFVSYGAAIYCAGASPTITRNRLINNTASPNGGGAIRCFNAHPEISYNYIVGNHTDKFGGAINLESSSPLIAYNVIANNTTPGSGGRGGGIYGWVNCQPHIVGNTLYGNVSNLAAGMYFHSSAPTIENNIIAFNENGHGIYCTATANPTMTCNNIYGNEDGDAVCGTDGGGNISADPLFCDAPGSEFTLQALSPSAPANNSCGVLMGAMPVGCYSIYIEPTYDIVTCADSVTFTFNIEDIGGGEEVRGYDVTYEIDEAVVTIGNTNADVVEGSFLSSVGSTAFYTIAKGGGVYTTSCAILGGTVGATGAGDLFTVTFLPVGEGISDIAITELKLRDPNNVHLPVRGLDAVVQIDCTPPTLQGIVEPQGECHNTAPSFSVFTFRDDVNLDLAEYQIDLDGWIPIFSALNDTVWSDPGWTIPGFAALTEGAHVIYFRVKDDAGNWNGDGSPDTYSWSFIKDTIAPDAPTDFLALPGHNKVHLTWTDPTGDGSWMGVEIRRVAWGDYPQYGTPGPGAPSYPATPTEGDFVTQTALGAYDDDPITPRDIYYYAAFSYDCAGNYSTATPTARDRSTSYWLSDIDPPLVGDGTVQILDLAAFSLTFGVPQGGMGWNAEADFGPTTDFSGVGIPLPDDIVDFEDLMILALNYGNVSPLGASGQPLLTAGTVDLQDIVKFRLDVISRDGNLVTYSVVVDNGAKTLKGFSIDLSYGITGELVAVTPAKALSKKASGCFFGTVQREMGRVEICVAALGPQQTLNYTGEIAHIAVRAGEAPVTLKAALLRDTYNRGNRVVIGDTGGEDMPVVPTESWLQQNHPNPFNPTTTLTYDVATPGHVTVAIYDVSGRLVRRLVDTHREIGRYTATWNSRDTNGNIVGTGVYFYRMTAPGYRSPARKMLLLK